MHHVIPCTSPLPHHFFPSKTPLLVSSRPSSFSQEYFGSLMRYPAGVLMDLVLLMAAGDFKNENKERQETRLLIIIINL